MLTSFFNAYLQGRPSGDEPQLTRLPGITLLVGTSFY